MLWVDTSDDLVEIAEGMQIATELRPKRLAGNGGAKRGRGSPARKHLPSRGRWRGDHAVRQRVRWYWQHRLGGEVRY